MWIRIVLFIVALCSETSTVHYPSNQASDMDEITPYSDTSTKTMDASEQEETERGLEIDKPIEETKDKDLLEEALKTVLNPDSAIRKYEIEDNVKTIIDSISGSNESLEMFVESMDKISLDSCEKAQEALWLFVTDNLNEEKKKTMVYAVNQESEVKKKYWHILKTQYMNQSNVTTDPLLRRKIRIIKEKAINLFLPKSKESDLISSMQRTWNNALVCAYNSSCGPRDIRTISGQYFFHHHHLRRHNNVKSTFRTSNDSMELRYYWQAFRDATGRKIRSDFEKYVSGVNNASKAENFTDNGDLWRFSFDDDAFTETVNRLWTEVKPLYTLLHGYVQSRLKKHYQQDLEIRKDTIPAHLLGSIWAQEWQSIYHLVTPYPDHSIVPEAQVTSRHLFEVVDDFFQSLGFKSFADEFVGVNDGKNITSSCLPTSHDMCDGTFRIHWCGEQEPIMRSLPRIAQLMGRVQYSSHYRFQPLVFRNGPTPAFPEAVSSLAATHLTSPEQLKRLGLLTANLTSEHFINHLLWKALEKLPLMGYAYVLDSWRWSVFSGASQDWNQLWWDLRVNETGISAPVSRNQSDLDPAAKYHVVSNVQYITYLISQVLECQLLLALCNATNHTGPLHQCFLYNSKTAGNLLSNGMELGSSEDWKTVLKAFTGETEISTRGILEYFKPLEEFLRKENIKFAQLNADSGPNVPIVIGVILLISTLAIVIAYCIREKGLGAKISSAIGISQNGSLDLPANEMSCQVNPKVNPKVADPIKEDKV